LNLSSEGSGLVEPWRNLATELGTHEIWALEWAPSRLGKLAKALHADAAGEWPSTPMRALGVHAPAVVPGLWTAAASEAKAAGRLLAEVVEQQALGRRSVSLVGFSLGARVVFHCLELLAERGALGRVQDVALLGAAVTSKPSRWECVRPVVAGRLVNAYSASDHFLRAHHRLAHYASPPPAGAVAVKSLLVENHDVGDALTEHRALAAAAPVLLRRLGVPLT